MTMLMLIESKEPIRPTLSELSYAASCAAMGKPVPPPSKMETWFNLVDPPERVLCTPDESMNMHLVCQAAARGKLAHDDVILKGIESAARHQEDGIEFVLLFVTDDDRADVQALYEWLDARDIKHYTHIQGPF